MQFDGFQSLLSSEGTQKSIKKENRKLCNHESSLNFGHEFSIKVLQREREKKTGKKDGCHRCGSLSLDTYSVREST
jgi:hypothetical protein